MRQLSDLGAYPTMPMAVASRSQLGTQQPRAQRASLGGRPPAAVTAALSIFSSHTPDRSTGPQPATLMVFTARAMLSRYMPWPCVCVCLSQVGVLLKWLNIAAVIAESRVQQYSIFYQTHFILFVSNSKNWLKNNFTEQCSAGIFQLCLVTSVYLNALQSTDPHPDCWDKFNLKQTWVSSFGLTSKFGHFKFLH